jgi:MFS family permease
MSARTFALAALTFAIMLPVTLPVPVLRGLVRDRFAVSDGEATFFMAANMVGALLAAPVFGAVADRTGWRRWPAVAALLLDAAAMHLLTRTPSFATFLVVRTLEGAAHIGALSLVLSLVADHAAGTRGRAMGALGAGLTLGVATGAALGGVLGRKDPLATLHAASAVLLAAAALASFVLPADTHHRRQPHLRHVARALTHRPGLLVPLAFSCIDRFTVGFFTAGFPLLLHGVHSIAPARIGVLLALFLYPFALLSYPIGKLAEGRSRVHLVALGSLIYGAGTACVGVVPPGFLFALMPLLGISSAVMFVPTLLLTIERAPEIARSSAIAAFNAAGSLGFLLGPLVCGAIVAQQEHPATGYAQAFAVAGLCEIACVALLLPSLRQR